MKNTSSEADDEIMVYLTSKSVGGKQFYVFLTLYILMTLAAGKILCNVCTLPTIHCDKHCTAGEQEVLAQKFSLNLSGNSSFCRENSTDK